MLLRDIIVQKEFGTWLFHYKAKDGLIFFDPKGESVHIHYGYNASEEMPEVQGDYENISIAINSFCIDETPLIDLLDFISCERLDVY